MTEQELKEILEEQSWEPGTEERYLMTSVRNQYLKRLRHEAVACHHGNQRKQPRILKNLNNERIQRTARPIALRFFFHYHKFLVPKDKTF